MYLPHKIHTLATQDAVYQDACNAALGAFAAYRHAKNTQQNIAKREADRSMAIAKRASAYTQKIKAMYAELDKEDTMWVWGSYENCQAISQQAKMRGLSFEITQTDTLYKLSIYGIRYDLLSFCETVGLPVKVREHFLSSWT